jgi:hypothetical protein
LQRFALSESDRPVRICGRRLLPSQLALLATLLQFAVALGMYLRLSPCEHVVRRDITDGAVQPNVVIAIYILLDQAFRLFQ